MGLFLELKVDGKGIKSESKMFEIFLTMKIKKGLKIEIEAFLLDF
jgi:hypothetical protein